MRGRAGAAALLLLAACNTTSGGQVFSSVDDMSAAHDLAHADLSLPAICDQVPSDDGGAPATLATVQQIFDRYCVDCHRPARDLVDLTAGASRASLVGQAATGDNQCGGVLVDPGNPAGSYLLTKLTASTFCNASVQRMPPGGHLQDCEIDLVRRWIADGALP